MRRLTGRAVKSFFKSVADPQFLSDFEVASNELIWHIDYVSLVRIGSNFSNGTPLHWGTRSLTFGRIGPTVPALEVSEPRAALSGKFWGSATEL